MEVDQVLVHLLKRWIRVRPVHITGYALQWHVVLGVELGWSTAKDEAKHGTARHGIAQHREDIAQHAKALQGQAEQVKL